MKASKSFQRVKKPSRQAILPQKHPNFRVIARPQRGRGNLKGEGMASRGEARDYKQAGILIAKNMRVAASFRLTIFRFGMTNRIVKDCRVAALLAMTKSVGLIENTERIIHASDSVKCFLPDKERLGSESFQAVLRGCYGTSD